MFFKQCRNLLPKKLSEGVALNHLISEHQLFRSGGLRKLLILSKFSKFSKLLLGILPVLFLSGYQPTLSIPPVQQAVVRAEFSQQQSIDATHLSEPFNLPHPGYLTTKYASWHPGIDIATGLGMPIRPISKGKVVEVTSGWFGLGHYVVVEHEQGFRSSYGHMGKIYVKKDDLVDATSFLGEVGMTGHTTGPHTHLEITKNGQYIDPQTILPAITNWPSSAGSAPAGQGEAREPKKAQSKVAEAKVKSAIIGVKNYQEPTQDPNVTKLSRLLLLSPDQSASQIAPVRD